MIEPIVLFGMAFNVLFILIINFYIPKEETKLLENIDEFPPVSIKPGGIIFRFHKFLGKLALKITCSDEKKIERLIKTANMRLAQLNRLDGKKVLNYSNKLYFEYGICIKWAKFYVQKLIFEGKTSEKTLIKLEAKVAAAQERRFRLNENVKEKIIFENKNKVEEIITKKSIFSRIEQDEKMNVIQEGYRYGELLKLKAVASLSLKSTDELIKIEDVVSTGDHIEKMINFNILFDMFNLTDEQVKYHLIQIRNNELI